MKVIGRKIFNMDMEKNPGLMVLIMKENIMRAKNMVKGIIFGMMGQNMKVNGQIIKLKVMEIINGKMAEYLKDIG